jgi:hypothetical protein
MNKKIKELEQARDTAMDEVRTWWDAGLMTGHCRDHTKAPAWPKYLAAFAALDQARERGASD